MQLSLYVIYVYASYGHLRPSISVGLPTDVAYLRTSVVVALYRF